MSISYGGNNITFPDASTQNTSPKTGFVNRIINGGMTIDQRNAGASVTVSGAGGYTLDRWSPSKDGVVNSFTCQRSSVAPAGFINSMLFTMGTGVTPTTTAYAYLAQNIEGFNCADLGFGTASAATVTLSFWVRSSVTGAFGVGLRSASGGRSYIASYTISSANTFEYKTITILGDTSGAWLTDNGIGIRVDFDLGVGPTYSTTAGSWQSGNFFGLTGGTKLAATTGATFYITGVQLEKGSTATPFEFRSIGDESNLCFRYYQTYSNPPLRGVYAASSAASRCGMVLPVVMRATPTATVGTLDFFDGNAVSTASSISVAYLNAKSVEFDFSLASAVMTAFRPAIVYQSGSTNNLFLTAEL